METKIETVQEFTEEMKNTLALPENKIETVQEFTEETNNPLTVTTLTLPEYKVLKYLESAFFQEPKYVYFRKDGYPRDILVEPKEYSPTEKSLNNIKLLKNSEKEREKLLSRFGPYLHSPNELVFDYGYHLDVIRYLAMNSFLFIQTINNR